MANTDTTKFYTSMSNVSPRLRRRYQEKVIAQADGIGIRFAFRIAISALAAIAFLAIISISYRNVTEGEFARANASVHSEVNYLCLQLQSLGIRSKAFDRVIDTLGATEQDLAAAQVEDVSLLSDPVGDVLQGYTLAETGTVLIASGDTVIASDDERVPVGGDLRELFGDDAYATITSALGAEEMQKIDLKNALADPKNRYGYLLSGQQGEYTIVIVEPSSMVFRDRNAIMGREATISFGVLTVVFLVVDYLLNLMVTRRIDRTNAALRRVVSGDLDERVAVEGTREFKSLAQGINVTVDALQDLIAEAESRMDAELATAWTIQEGALPRTFPPYPDIPRFDIYASMDPAREVGGDFYDFFLVGKGNTAEAGKFGFVIADVSGKGVPAALFMMKAKALIRDHVGSGKDLGSAVTKANSQICEGNDETMFVTAWIGVLDYGTGHIEYVNAGHNPPLLRRTSGDWEWQDKKSGPMLGLFDVTYKAYSIECARGDELLLYTDGVTEAFDVDENLYGEERLMAFVERAGALHPRRLVCALRDDVAAHAEGAEQSDDITIMSLEVV